FRSHLPLISPREGGCAQLQDLTGRIAVHPGPASSVAGPAMASSACSNGYQNQ
ncbi:hypothetical protein STEG23_002199, partial [Scotinomys teguina]